jgi:hypothetical protein
MLVATLNLLGNAYNPMEFMNQDDSFVRNYTKIRESFKALTTAEVLEQALKLGFNGIDNAVLGASCFETNCTKDFLDRDNKLELPGRTNLVVSAMMPADDQRGALYLNLASWRNRMETQRAHYARDPQLVCWDIACNLAVERCADEFAELCRGSYLDPERTSQNIATMLNELPHGGDRDVVCGIQEFPEDGTLKYTALLRELPARGLKHLKADGANSSVGFILSAHIEVESVSRSPLGQDVDAVLVALGISSSETIDARDRESLKTTARKTFVVDIKQTDLRPGLRLVAVHAKEFKSDEGTRLLARYLREVAKPAADRAALVVVDSNTSTKSTSALFDEACRASQFEVLSPSGAYTTTRKKRSEMHGQIYDTKKCLKSVEAHKTFVMLAQNSGGYPVWEPVALARAIPDLPVHAAQTLPSAAWPTDHFMLQVELRCKM